ncbi:Domain of uncharacterised function (DUF2088) [Slackia heliotrinireducens]|uniref:Uncharacterized conserved protein n=1 Tax=Slackia heliotrinireducens (strain ATCC 29202 / DSM 20476 / NCTC 11029 / RHS 1) TaxID=471855 RepID=C7N3G6_SLAHD|nr:nickel-dependent lactate racemase [Slackia heliotrinireducens]ACV23689.1 uncharacterized conserved protein [Slackia heliotrinireducens DSM 20476]VEH03245.1 Domain of uncharacterised function (DUF2088) [Slackia heliotrinireducens]
MRIEVGYDNTVQWCDIDEKNLMGIMKANEVEYERTGAEEVAWALQHPIASKKLSELVSPGNTVAIITSDITRPLPTYTVLPPVLDELYAAGVEPKDITLVFALGSHRAHTEEEKLKLAGERAYNEINLKDSNEDPFVHYGTTKGGTPIDIMKTVADADVVVCLGNIEYHYFAGYSGGYKAVMPGVSTMEAIEANHTRMVDPNSCAGKLDGNPVREDIDEAGAIVGVDFIVNVVLDEDKQVIKAVAGDVVKAHREGCKFLDKLYRIEIEKRADIVIDSQGGAPKDMNLYQTQKALDNAKYAIKEGGVIILVGCCKEGLGQKTFQEWMLKAEEPADIIRFVQEDFKLGGHKASAVAKIMLMADIYLVSELDPELARNCFFTPFSTLEEAYEAALKKMGDDAQVLVMPHGGSTVPKVIGEQHDADAEMR